MAHLEIPRTHYSPQEVANLIGTSRQFVASLCKEGKIKGVARTSGGHWRIPTDAVKGVDGIDARPVIRVGSASA